MNFDLEKDYDEDLLIHEQSGGGKLSIFGLSGFKFKPEIAEYLNNIVNPLGKYDAVHVRNTSHQTDYKPFLNEIKPKLKNKIIVCTDDANCISYSKKLFGDKLIEIHKVPDYGGIGIYRAKEDFEVNNMDMLTDLMLLAKAETLYKTKLVIGKYSGFTRLAMSLRTNPEIIRKLLNN